MLFPFLGPFFKSIKPTLLSLLLFTSIYAQNFNLVQRSHLPYPGKTCANIWYYVDSLNNEYALVGAQNGLSIVNVTDPDNPFEVALVPGPDCLWREVKTHGKFAYVTTECKALGLQIVNLSHLPSTNIPSKFWSPKIKSTGPGSSKDTLKSIHALHIDNGFAYLYGTKPAPGFVAADLSDPWNPTVAGYYDAKYIHDGYVRNDTMYAGNIINGYFSVIDLKNKANPKVLQTQETPNRFTHNTWLSDNGKYLFTTDETANSFLASYDISNLNNISELDRFQPTPGSGSVVHNTHVLNDYAVTSWYTDGVVIVDVHRPQNLVPIAIYDLCSDTGYGYKCTWGVCPYLPSGNIVASNIDEGLFVLTPTYKRASYLEGMVSDSSCNVPISGVSVTISGWQFIKQSDIGGLYRTGLDSSGYFDITFSKPGYNSVTLKNIRLATDSVTTINLKLFSPINLGISGHIKDKVSSLPIQGTDVFFENPDYNFHFTSDQNGDFSRCDFFSSPYNLTIGKWGYETKCFNSLFIDQTNDTATYFLKKGYYDDFSLNFGWTTTQTSNGGEWQRGYPSISPPNDAPYDCGSQAFVTGLVDNNYVQNGDVGLYSPWMDLTSYNDPYISYYRYYLKNTGDVNDHYLIYLKDDTTKYLLEDIKATASFWKHQEFRVKDFCTPSNKMQVYFLVSNGGSVKNNKLEAGVDVFRISEGPVGIGIAEADNTISSFTIYPNPFSENITVKTQSNSQGLLWISDVLGNKIKETNLTSELTNLDLENLEAGIYFISIAYPSKSITTKKIVKTH